MNKNTIILYHGGGCLDGFGAAYAAWLKFQDEAEYIPVHYGNKPPEVNGKDVYILDFSYPRDTLLQMAAKARTMTVLDHHKTAEEDLRGITFATFDMAKSGCILAWEHFHNGKEIPLSLRYIQDRDLWKFEYPGTKAFCEGLRNNVDFNFEKWDKVAKDLREVRRIAVTGEMLLRIFDREIENLLPIAYEVIINGEKGLAVNANAKYASELGNRLAQKSGTFGVVWYYDGSTGKANYSLRSIGDYDVSAVAKQFGGGGHKNAAGFSADATELMPI